jgi:hypothetical protein
MELELVHALVGTGAGGGGVAAGMIVQQYMAKQNGKALHSDLAEIKAVLGTLVGRVERVEAKVYRE